MSNNYTTSRFRSVMESICPRIMMRYYVGQAIEGDDIAGIRLKQLMDCERDRTNGRLHVLAWAQHAAVNVCDRIAVNVEAYSRGAKVEESTLRRYARAHEIQQNLGYLMDGIQAERNEAGREYNARGPFITVGSRPFIAETNGKSGRRYPKHHI
ncbi:MAG: hypothetical protein SFW62_00610 [Alphaproteobacteria bacterium]|nr:hypothetical protein [Alphaproteobacteria bacterium]